MFLSGLRKTFSAQDDASDPWSAPRFFRHPALTVAVEDSSGNNHIKIGSGVDEEIQVSMQNAKFVSNGIRTPQFRSKWRYVYYRKDQYVYL